MGIEKDTTFKYIGKNFLRILFDLADIPENVKADNIDEVTEELISLNISQFRPDFIGKDDNTIVMIEYESKHVGISSKKRFHVYVALYDYERNPDDLDIIFLVITTKEKSKVVEYTIGETDKFKILIFNIRDLGFEKIISNAKNKIRNSEEFSDEELVKLALTSLMPDTREGNIRQFETLSEMTDDIIFESEEAKVSFFGILILLSEIYFDKNDSIRKKIQGDCMARVDAIAEMREEQFNAGLMEAAKNFLKNGVSPEIVSKSTNQPLEKIKLLQKEIISSK